MVGAVPGKAVRWGKCGVDVKDEGEEELLVANKSSSQGSFVHGSVGDQAGNF